MKKQSLCFVLSLFLGSSSLTAQQGWFVDPVGGNNLNGGQSQGDAVKTLGKALQLASAGDNVFCLPGTYSAASGEAFPVGVKNGVRISGLGGIPVFDGGGATVLFNLGGNISQETELSGLSFTDAVITFQIQSGRSVDGLVLQDCSFDGDICVFANLTTNTASQEFEVNGCTFTSSGGTVALAISIDDGELSGGGFINNQILGDFDVGVSLIAASDGEIAAGFVVQQNTLSGCGISAVAFGDGGNGLSVATVAATILAKALDGLGVGAVGIELASEIGSVGEGALVSCYVCFNEIAGFDVAVHSSTDNDLNNRADVTSDFYGNVFSGDGTGVLIEAAQPNPLNRNSDPNFGGHPDGGVARFNTFEGFATDFDLAITQNSDLYAGFCWWDGAPVFQDGTLLTQPILNDSLQATASGSIDPNTAGEILTLTASATSGFVDFAQRGPPPTGQIAVEVDGFAIPDTDIAVPVPGNTLAITLPSLVPGLHSVEVTNPGGQSGLFDFLVGALGGAAASGCFVATAAHGDYNAPEVLALRGLRDEYLATSAPGRSFIRWYYREGPTAAAWIAERPWARATTRVALQPAVWTSRALTKWNPGERFAFALLLLGVAFTLVRRRTT